MRSIVTLSACIALGLLATGCDSITQRNYQNAGIGTDLYTTELPETTKALDDYLAYICDQAGLNAQSCAEATLQPANWTVFVQAGMNDIDRRCDSYLSWLDDQKRSRQPILQQIADTNAATQIVLAETGVAAAPMAIVGAAFGFARHTFTNVQSRLILEVDHSTVQSLVLAHQRDFRLQILGDSKTPGIRIPNKPTAIHALRSYLRICMPFTIETEINTTLTTIDRGGADALADNPLIDARTVGSLVLPNATTPLPRPLPPPGKDLADRFTAREQSLSGLDITNIQTMLCMAPPYGTLGPMTSPTRNAIHAYLAGRSLRSPTRKIEPSNTIGPRTGDLLTQAVNQKAGCFDTVPKFKDAFEVGRYGFPKSGAAAEIKNFQDHLTWALKAQNSTTTAPATGIFDAATRTAIGELRLRLENKWPTVAGAPAPSLTTADTLLDQEIDTKIMATPKPG